MPSLLHIGRRPVRAKQKICRRFAASRYLRLNAYRRLALWFLFIDRIADNSLIWLTQRNWHCHVADM
jgi:hypothetical protein